MTPQVELVTAAIDPAALLARFTAGLGGEGAVTSFTGHARDRASDGVAVHALELETYRGVTLASMKEIAADAQARFAIGGSLVVHRAGRILPGEAIVFVAVAARHRRAAFQAVDYLMDRLKSEAVFWKREMTAAGSRWIEPTAADHADRARWTSGEE